MAPRRARYHGQLMGDRGLIGNQILGLVVSRNVRFPGPPIDHVDGSLHGLDAEPVQGLLEGLTFQASRIKRRLSPTSECPCAVVLVSEMST
jgi:hypothetical protein